MLECEIELLLANSGHLASDSSVLYFAFDDGPYHEIQLTLEGINSIPSSKGFAMTPDGVPISYFDDAATLFFSADDVITKPKAAAKIIAELTEDGAKIKELIKKADSGANGDELAAILNGDVELFRAIKEGDTKLVEAIKENRKLLEAAKERVEAIRIKIKSFDPEAELEARLAARAEEDILSARKMNEDMEKFIAFQRKVDDEAVKDLVIKRAEAKQLKDLGAFDDAAAKAYDELLIDIVEETRITRITMYGTLDDAAAKDMGTRIAMDRSWKKAELRRAERMAKENLASVHKLATDDLVSKVKPITTAEETTTPYAKINTDPGITQFTPEIKDYKGQAQKLADEFHCNHHEGGTHDGHVIKMHIAKPKELLEERIKNDPRIRGSTSFPDIDTANKYIQATLRRNEDAIVEWLVDNKPWKTFASEFTETVGYGFNGAGQYSNSITKVAVRLIKAENGPLVLTAYPLIDKVT